MRFSQGSVFRTAMYFVAALVIFIVVSMLGFTVGQADFQQIFLFYTFSFVAYFLVFHFAESSSTIWFFTGLGILLRIVLIFSFPNLSDDVYRFIWDGTLAINSINPFHHLPANLMESQTQIPGITPELFEKLNSPGYFTVYPPVCQAIFATGCWLFPESWAGNAMVMKSFMAAFEAGSIFLIVKLLRHFKLPLKNVLLYALNPLVMIEITGNLHFEGAMIFFLLLSVWLLVKDRLQLSAVAFALSIASKLLPLMFLPLLIRRLGWARSFQYFGIVGICLILLFLPLTDAVFFQHLGNSLNLYFQKFEFNASIYYLLRWIFKSISGYNQIALIGPALGLTALVTILFFIYKEKRPTFENLFTSMLFTISVYLFLATTVHPWYVMLPVVVSVFTPFRFPVLWSYLVVLTYINYSYVEYYENLWLVGLEYAAVFVFLWWEWGITHPTCLKQQL